MVILLLVRAFLQFVRITANAVRVRTRPLAIERPCLSHSEVLLCCLFVHRHNNIVLCKEGEAWV